MTKQQALERILDVGIVPVVRVSSPKLVMLAAEAICNAGIPIVEITMTTPGALDVIGELTRSIGSENLIGAGTVLDAEMAQSCLDAGAEFIVGPAFDRQTVNLVNREGKLMMAGALTPTELVRAWNAGSALVKVFPCSSLGGPSYIRALKAPLPHIALIPTGGVTLQNAADFIRAGASAIGIGSELVSNTAVESGNGSAITAAARAYLAVVREARPPESIGAPRSRERGY